jgi:hypothetical protein
MQPSSDVRVGARRATQRRRERSGVRRRIAAGADQEEIFRKSLWSALQTHLQGIDGATLAIVPEKCRHRAALPISKPAMSPKYPGVQRKASHALVGSHPKSPRGHAAGWHHLIAARRAEATVLSEIRRWRACARFRRRLRRCGRPARGSARSAAACRGNSPAPRRSPRPTGN